MAENFKGLTIQEIDTNMLFEKYSIDDIRSIEKRTGADIERKKEELRQMVGERYRDLIEAADTITDMKCSAANVLQSLTSIQNHCHSLNQTHMIKGVSGSRADSHRGRGDTKIYDVASQIELLLDMPEKMWGAIDRKQYLEASELYLLSRHIHTSVQSGKQISTDLLHSFPVLSWQWTAIAHFKATILQGCHGMLKKEAVSDQVVADCLSSIILLEESNIRQVFTEFLLARSNAIGVVFQDSHDSIKSQVCRVVQLLQTSILQIYALFHEDSHMLLNTLNNVTSSSTASRVLDTSPFKHLPATVFEYSPTLSTSVANISLDNLKERCLEWINTCQATIKTGMGQLLCYINTVKGLAAIRDALWDLLNQDCNHELWRDVCHHVIQKPLLIWEDFIQPLIYSRAQEIVHAQFDTTQQVVQQHITELLSELSSEKCQPSNHDLASFIWTESSKDVPDNTAWTASHKKSLRDGGGLLMKAKAYTLAVQRLCGSVDSKVKLSLEDVYTYCVSDDSTGPFMKTHDNISILTCLQTSCTQFIHKLLKFIKGRLDDSEQLLKDKNSSHLLIIDRILVLGRICQGLCELTPHLYRCVMGQEEKEHTVRLKRARSTSMEAGDKSGIVWNQVKADVMTCGQQAFDLWSCFISAHLVDHFTQSVCNSTVHNRLINATRWDDIDVEEETEQGEKVKSIIRVPCQPSWYVTAILFEMCREINRVGGHAVCRKSLVTFIRQTQQLIVDAYAALLDENKESSWMSVAYTLSQPRALQHMFDLKFINNLLGRKNDHEDNAALSKKVGKLIEHLEACVDPFDLDVFMPHMDIHLFKHSQRALVLFGALTCGDQQGLFMNSRTTHPSTQEQHNVLPLTTNCARFSILPITAPQPLAEKTLQKQIKPKASQPIITLASRTQSSQMKTSASFYDKLGSLWS